ncbi:nucleotidyltransferase domain-containing protein [Achromobacter ruhlandii]|uniref:nucleotidyltransferase domain-containing protein n=1 Tax=Achromobacter ruhlandii TaxID=72557 RepID=UPI0007BF3E21|nr:nucleotidyltransferase domain-containing protein [Achromobacter ruhlandii]
MTSILHAHPIDPAIRECVMATLEQIEQRHDVRVLLACESGSRGWGFASPDSDYDVRFLYVHKLDWYLRVAPQRDVIELPIDDELDVSGWELRKALQLLRGSNPTLFEWLDSPVLYRQDDATSAWLRHFRSAYFSHIKGRWHYVAMAGRNFRESLQGDTVRLKKYLYVLRPVLAAQWIDSGRGIPPMRFADLADAMVTDPALRDEINALLAIKMQAGEAEHGPRFPLIHAYLETTLPTLEKAPFFDRPDGQTERLDRFLYEVVTGAPLTY